MADNKPRQPGSGDEGAPKLPPRSGDWQSGLKKSDPEKPRKSTAPDTVSDFLAKERDTESDWDPVDSDDSWKQQFPQQDKAGKASGGWDPVDSPARSHQPAATATATVADNYTDDNEPPRTWFSFYTTRTRFTDILIAIVLAVLAFASVAFTYNGIGHSWDEALYLKPAQRAAAWMVGVINSGDDSMMSSDAIDRHWGQALTGHDPLHPEVAPVPKLLPGAGLTYLQNPPQVDAMTAMRLPNAIVFGLTVALLFLLGTREYGRIGGFAAALFYALMPRVFGHAHIAASETPLAFCVVLTTWCFLVGNRFWPFALFTGIALGLAIATKVTALALPIPLMIWGQLYKRREYGSNVFAMAFVAPLVALALWPWLWYDTYARVVSYIAFYLEHQQTAVYYAGRIWGYGRPSAPFYYVPHITVVVIPIWILFFIALGLLRALFTTISRPVTILFVLMAAFWMGLAMLPGSPRYDGERLWFPTFAFLALLSGGGFSLVFAGVRRWRDRRDRAGAPRETSYIALLALLVFGVYGTVDMVMTHPNELNYYNWIVGRSKGAYERGFETAYWGEAVNEDVTSYLRSILKPGDKVKTLALNEEAFENLRQWQKLPANVDFSPDEPPYDYAILQVRQGFMTPRERQLWLGSTPLQKFEVNGVPRILVYDAAAVAKVFPGPAPDEVTTGTVEGEVGRTSDQALPVPANGTTVTLPVTAPTTASQGITTPTAEGAIITTSGATIRPVNTEMTTAAATRANDRRTSPPAADADPDNAAGTTTPTAVLDLPSTAPGSVSATTTTPAGIVEDVPGERRDNADTATTGTGITDETATVSLDLSTTPTEALPQVNDAGTSAANIYEDDPPTTGPASISLPVPSAAELELED